MPIRKATWDDLKQINGLYDQAKAFLRAQGLDQWQDGYPNRDTARADIAANNCFVFEEDYRLLGTACLAFGREPTYETIYQGQWLCDPPIYGFLHRIAVTAEARGKGVAPQFFALLKDQANEKGITVIRGDTHRGNLPMQRVMEKSGLEYRGIIYLENGDERLAYEGILDTHPRSRT